MTSGTTVRVGLVAAGLVNILGVFLFSVAYSNTNLTLQYPEVFSTFGLIVIQVVGLIYIAAAFNWESSKYVLITLFLEKMLYVGSWIYWQKTHDLTNLFKHDAITATYFAIYGPIDFVFGTFFLFAACLAHVKENEALGDFYYEAA